MRRKREGAYIGSLRLPNCERVELFSILLSNENKFTISYYIMNTIVASLSKSLRT